MNTPATLDAAQIAVTRNMNLIVSHDPGSGIFSATRNSLIALTGKVVIVDASRLTLWDLQMLDTEAEVLVFDEFQHADPETKESIRSLMEKRSADHAPAMPKLKSVVVVMTALGNWDEIDAAAQELAQLAPSVVVRVANPD